VAFPAISGCSCAGAYDRALTTGSGRLHTNRGQFGTAIAEREAIAETLAMAIYMGAGPSVMYAAEALEATDQMAKGAAKPIAVRQVPNFR
jgi:hypothetical protein